MKRIGNLKNKWCNYGNLLEAFYEIKKHKSYNEKMLYFENNLVTKLNEILIQLQNNNYEVSVPREFYVYEPKKRLIKAPSISDRLVQHAVLRQCRNILENKFLSCSFACRKGKGTHSASKLLQKYLKEYKDKGYYLKIDIKKFFYNIDHDILESMIRRIIKCEDSIRLLVKFFRDGTGKGLPLGSVTSQLFANLYLNRIDHYIKRSLKHKHYIRYMDDLIILCEDKNTLRHSLRKINIEVGKIILQINNKTIIGRLKEGIDFVGYKTWYNRKVIRKRNLYKIKKILKHVSSVQIIITYLAHSLHSNSYIYVKSLIKHKHKNNILINKFINKHKDNK